MTLSFLFFYEIVVGDKLKAILKIAISFCLFIVWISSAQCQLLSGTISDASTGEKLPGANIYIANTNIGCTSNVSGKFLLDCENFNEFLLIVSFIGYHTYSKKVDLNASDSLAISLTPKTSILDEVTIETTLDKAWKRDFRKFKKAFLGNSTNARNCEILNPWVLEFSKKGTALMASAKDVLKIKNNGLGYITYYLLDDFSLDVESLSFGGKSHFTELDTSSSLVRNRWQNNRNKAYLGSKSHFFRSLVANQLEDEGFEIYEVKQVGSRFLTTKRLNSKSILIVDDEGNHFVKFNNFLKVVYLNASAPNAYLNDRMFVLEDATSENLSIQKGKFIRNNLNNSIGSSNENVSQSSLLYLRADKIELDENGNLKDHLYLNEFGYWAWLRVGDLMPSNYVPANNNLKPDINFQTSETATKNGFLLNNLIIPEKDILSGGVRKDGIPALNNPGFVSPEAAKFLKPSDKVISVSTKEGTKAYPIKILNYHELVNVDDYLVTYCPLCASGLVFKNKIDDDKLEFGVSGLLYNSDVLMYDKKTESLWSQLLMKSVSGHYSGVNLEIIPSTVMNWSAWKEQHADGLVLSDKTGFDRDYNKNPYEDYDSNPSTIYPLSSKNNILPDKTKIYGIAIDGEYRAYPVDLLNELVFVEDEIGSTAINIKHDRKANTTYATDGLGNIINGTTMYWFAWYAFHPTTTVYSKK